MFDFRPEDARPGSRLREAFGEEIELVDENGKSVPFRILAEFSLDNLAYAVLQNQAMAKDGEYDVYRIVEDGGGLGLESIEDDEEWDAAAEIYDALTFPDGD